MEHIDIRQWLYMSDITSTEKNCLHSYNNTQHNTACMAYDIANYGTTLCLISHPSVSSSCSGPSIPLSINLEHYHYPASPFTLQAIYSINAFNKYMKALVKNIMH